MRKNMTRRQFLKLLAVALGATGITIKSLGQSSLAQSINRNIFLPWISGNKEAQPTPTNTSTGTIQPTDTTQPTDPAQTSTATPTETPRPTPSGTPGPLTGKVVHVHSENATSWDGTDPAYWNYVDQDVVNQMVDEGVLALTNSGIVDDAWRVLLPNYQPGQGIAIKVNFNNSNSCDDMDEQIDAIVEPVNAVIRGLKRIGVIEEDIWVYDAMRPIPNRFVSGILYQNIKFYDYSCRLKAQWAYGNPDAYITFNPPPGVPTPPAICLTEVIVDASYLINIPIMKYHTNQTGASLSFKNHFGSIDNPAGLHNYINFDNPYYSPTYSVFVDLFLNPNIMGKTILTIGDGLLASKSYYGGPPQLWTTFGGHVPNSIFLSKDPVAFDCVLCDLLDAEITLPDAVNDYLNLASNAGLGTYERGDPWGSGYSLIDYIKINI
jgi:hypothetical protein